MSELQILGPLGNIHINIALIIAELAGVPLKHVVVEHKEATGKEFVKKYPLGLIPILITPDRETILTPVAIFKYIARAGKQLLGSSPLDETKIDQFLDIILGNLHKSYEDITTSIYGYREYDETSVKNAKKLFEKNLKFINDALKIDTYLVGQKLSIVDIALAAVLHRTFKIAFDDKFRSENPHTVRHLRYFSSIPVFSKYFGRLTLASGDWAPAKKAAVKA
ncbi:glutathione S-transferase, carboxy-terminal domain protein (macronuclear) [Tetrahymena thermophila SB210]|uniref:Glutathione S-transferase, carboxy-terminal domain protein n=1 Tax=Tetrahymena thermophila (strain SB210) TaxID=312017 RepID=Q22LV8_TETTS|nr:glutathione S-transferase, carboxy-terminal domain protein [Tetrahymena thermophila SB210]EAR86261.2 glutathione S-transferase, carboxy-terminal domain protein [Tetrahymena thermophila SB210]|eukprot:XP_977262.2 glutathione S-transferase, carboxy-terminal domain protein [Tetrahymena thermophila SB210]